MGSGSKFHKDKIARRKFCKEGQFRTEGHFCTRVKKKKITFKIYRIKKFKKIQKTKG